MKTTRIVLTIPEEHGDTLRAEALRLGYISPQNLLLALLRGDVRVGFTDNRQLVQYLPDMEPINIPPAAPGRKKGKQ